MVNKNYSLQDSLGHLSSAASRAVLKKINADLNKKGIPITSEQFSVLVHIWDQNGQAQYQLVEVLYKDKTTIARLLANLESLGLILRIAGQNDAREKNVYLTDKGQSMIAHISDIVQDILCEGQKGIDKKSLEICKVVLSQFHRNLVSMR